MSGSSAMSELWLKWLAGSAIPPHWLYEPILPESERKPVSGKLRIEIVSHCWQYSRLLAYQLDSLIRHPVQEADVTLTVFYNEEDLKTKQLLELALSHNVNNVRWNWQHLPKSALFRRSIGRNQAALVTNADWVWFTDCDMTFQEGCLDSLNSALQYRTDALVYPGIEQRTRVYTDADLVSSNSLETIELLEAPKDLFSSFEVSRATGPLQITHGDVARAMGYCKNVSYYQKPAEKFQKATEDRFFRYLLGTQGVPVDVSGVCRIQHVNKGRYDDASTRTQLRKKLRRWQYAWRNRDNPSSR